MRRWGPLIAVCLGTFMLLVDVTIVTVALPKMADDLGASFAGLQWVLDGYALALAALLLGAGSLADRFGRRRIYLVGLVLFAVASLSCALAPNAGVLIAARAVQGVGGAAMLATTVALLTAAYSGRERGIAFGVWGAVSGAAAASGPILGGLLTEYLNWPAIFLVNLPISVLTVVLSALLLTESRNPAAGRLDLPGMATFTIAAGAVTFALIRGAADGWTSVVPLGLFGTAAVALLAFVLIERRRRAPMLDLALFRSASFVGLLAGAVLLQASAFGYLVYTSMWLQSVLGDSPIRAGLIGSMALSAASFVVSAVAGRFLHHISPRIPVGVGMLLVGAGALLQSGLGTGSGGYHLIPGLIVAGVGVGFSLPTMSSAVMSAVPLRRAGMAGGALNTFRQLGLAMGIAVLGGVFRSGVERALRADGHVTDPHALGGALSAGQAHVVVAHAPAASRATLDRLVHHAFAVGLNDALLVAGIIGLVGAVLVLLLVGRRTRQPQEEPVRLPAAAGV